MMNSFYGRELLNYLAYDKIYPSKKDMDAACRDDNISIGRNVVVKYTKDKITLPTEDSTDINDYYGQTTYELPTLTELQYSNLYFSTGSEFTKDKIYKIADGTYVYCHGTITFYTGVASGGEYSKEKIFNKFNMYEITETGLNEKSVLIYPADKDGEDIEYYDFVKNGSGYNAQKLYYFTPFDPKLQANINTYCANNFDERNNYHNTIWQKQYDPEKKQVKYVLLTDLNSGPEWEEI